MKLCTKGKLRYCTYFTFKKTKKQQRLKKIKPRRLPQNKNKTKHRMISTIIYFLHSEWCFGEADIDRPLQVFGRISAALILLFTLHIVKYIFLFYFPPDFGRSNPAKTNTLRPRQLFGSPSHTISSSRAFGAHNSPSSRTVLVRNV